MWLVKQGFPLHILIFRCYVVRNAIPFLEYFDIKRSSDDLSRLQDASIRKVAPQYEGFLALVRRSREMVL